MAFDATYLTGAFSQIELHEQRALVGGVWNPESMANSFLPISEQLDIRGISRARSMLEFLLWDPSAKRKLPLSICSLPAQHNFHGANAHHRGNWYTLETIGMRRWIVLRRCWHPAVCAQSSPRRIGRN